MTSDIIEQVILFQYTFWLAMFPLLFGMWILKRWIFD